MGLSVWYLYISEQPYLIMGTTFAWVQIECQRSHSDSNCNNQQHVFVVETRLIRLSEAVLCHTEFQVLVYCRSRRLGQGGEPVNQPCFSGRVPFAAALLDWAYFINGVPQRAQAHLGCPVIFIGHKGWFYGLWVYKRQVKNTSEHKAMLKSVDHRP